MLTKLKPEISQFVKRLIASNTEASSIPLDPNSISLKLVLKSHF